MGGPKFVRGTGVVYPTFAAELLRARETLTLGEAVGLAFRAVRRESDLSQRAYAQARGWSKTHQHRLEREADSLGLAQVVHALADTGFTLALVGQAPNGAEGEGKVLRGADWPDAELVARDHGDRRFPPTGEVRRVGRLPLWWLDRHSTGSRPPPDWTSARH